MGIWPNPSASSLINVNIAGGEQLLYAAQLYNMSGEVVWTGQLNAGQSQLHLNSITSGIYYLTLQTSQGQIHEKIIVKK
jgi:chitinase